MALTVLDLETFSQRPESVCVAEAVASVRAGETLSQLPVNPAVMLLAVLPMLTAEVFVAALFVAR